jgi:hypothetical protein
MLDTKLVSVRVDASANEPYGHFSVRTADT